MIARKLRHALLCAFLIYFLSLIQATVADDSQLAAKSNTPTAPAPAHPEFGIKEPPQMMKITASQITGDFTLTKFVGKVIVIDEGMELTADCLFVHRNTEGETTKMIATGEKNDVVFKSTGGEIDGKQMQPGEASGKTLVYEIIDDGKNDGKDKPKKITLTGNPVLKYEDGRTCKGAEKVTFSVAAKDPNADPKKQDEWQFATEGGRPTITFPRNAGLFKSSNSKKKQ